ncbi:ATP-dependent Clp protease adaptor protein ClpS [Rhodococcus coprophilus]|uniref:ATP-dependent Clp protease adapter protein ClpS n=2 Tax=Rhodococcus coprophilus TaxID=38310 RepID=A0A2X4U9Y6_9NOCA|nr:ATP-dependent Clp protease adaptor protein ClpS [Rhodococcus coprophilus]
MGGFFDARRRRTLDLMVPGSTTDEFDVRMMAAGQAVPAEAEAVEGAAAVDRPWVTVVWDDPVNLMHYVTFIFQKLFGYSKAKATELMLEVHNEGKAVVSSGTRDKMEHDVERLHAAGLWATMQRDE